MLKGINPKSIKQKRDKEEALKNKKGRDSSPELKRKNIKNIETNNIRKILQKIFLLITYLESEKNK